MRWEFRCFGAVSGALLFSPGIWGAYVVIGLVAYTCWFLVLLYFIGIEKSGVEESQSLCFSRQNLENNWQKKKEMTGCQESWKRRRRDREKCTGEKDNDKCWLEEWKIKTSYSTLKANLYHHFTCKQVVYGAVVTVIISKEFKGMYRLFLTFIKNQIRVKSSWID